jgi:chaperonin GroEL
MRKQTLYGEQARAAILEGVKKIAAAVKCTLGPSGRNVLISQSMVVDYGVHSLPVHLTKDGYTTARGFDLDDPHEKAGVLLVKEAAQKSVDQSGDGTSTTVLLAEAIATKGIELIKEGYNPMELKRGIDKAVEQVVAAIKNMATPIKGDIEKIRQIATVSANNDIEIGNLIADAFAKIGDEGVIDIEPGNSVRTEIRIADGYKFERSFVSPWFMNNKEKQTCEFENPYILLYEKRINHHTQVEKILEKVSQTGRAILIICEDADEEGLAFLVMNSSQKRLKCCVVKAPAFGDARREEMEDIAILTGGFYITDSKGVGIKEAGLEHLGSARKVVVNKDETIIIGGEADKMLLENQLNELRMNLTQTKNEDEAFPIEKRIARLTGGVAVIQVGASTETEMKEKLDRFDDAVRATKSAIAEGFVPGAGTTFLRIKTNNPVIDPILDAPLRQICINAGVDVEQIVEKVRCSTGNIGYNAKTDDVQDLVEAGIIDPAKVLRCAIQNAASVASMILTTEVLIADTL